MFCSFVTSAVDPKTAPLLQTWMINSYQLMWKLLQGEHCFTYISWTWMKQIVNYSIANSEQVIFWALTQIKIASHKKMPATQTN